MCVYTSWLKMSAIELVNNFVDIQFWLYLNIFAIEVLVISPTGNILGKRLACILPGWGSILRCSSLPPSLESLCSFMVVPPWMITYQGQSTLTCPEGTQIQRVITEVSFIVFSSAWRFVIPGTTSPCVHCVTMHAATGSWWRHVEQLGRATCLTTQQLSFSQCSWLSGVPCFSFWFSSIKKCSKTL